MSEILESMMLDLKKKSFEEGWEACKEQVLKFLDKNDIIKRYGKELEDDLSDSYWHYNR